MQITPQEYTNRRQALWQKMPTHSMAILPAASLSLRNGDTEFPFRQDSDFYYLTGFDEPEAMAVFIKDGADAASPKPQFLLFNAPNDPIAAVWTGPRLGDAVSQLGVDRRYDLAEWPTVLPELLMGRQRVYHSFGFNSLLDHQVIRALKQVRHQQRRDATVFEGFEELRPLIAEQRVLKTSAEIALIEHAGKISGLAHQRLMQTCKPGMHEYQLEASFLESCVASGARFMAYPSIVAAGKNACILHYTRNEDVLKADQLVLVDAGAEVEGYASDITRTFPVGGRFSPEQKAVYEVVLKAQTEALAIVRPGTPWTDLQDTVVRNLVEGLIDVGVIKGTAETWIKENAYRKFYMHGSGHWLGLDVHDVGSYRTQGKPRPLEKNMVFTVEPGIYLPADWEEIEPRWRGIGIRIEDDVVVTAKGHTCLTPHAPKTVADIEACMRG